MYIYAYIASYETNQIMLFTVFNVFMMWKDAFPSFLQMMQNSPIENVAFILW